MNKFDSSFRRAIWLSAFLFAALAAGCGGGGDQGRDPVLGTGGIAVPAPMVTAVAPVNNATGVPFNTTIITVSWWMMMDTTPVKPLQHRPKKKRTWKRTNLTFPSC